MTSLGSQPEPSAAPPSPQRGTPPGLTGGEGFSYEDAVAAVYAVALLGESPALGLPARTVTHVAFQRAALGQPLDDLVVRARGADQSEATFSAQIKEGLVISASKTNIDFRQTIERAHLTVAASGFEPGRDRVGVIVGEIADASRRNFETLCEWARAESSAQMFARKLNTSGMAGAKLAHYEAVREILAGQVAAEEVEEAAHKLLAHFVLIRLELLAEGSPVEVAAVTSLANQLAPVDRPRADDLWRRLLALVRVLEGRAAGFDRKTLIARLNGAFRLAGAPSMSAVLQAIVRETQLALQEIASSIQGLSVPRERHVQEVTQAFAAPGLLQISGLPGAGKSVVLRRAAEHALEDGPVLFLKADRLQGKTWPQYAAATGLAGVGLADLLVELSAVGRKVVFIDGLDRIEVGCRGVLNDILQTLLSSPLLGDWAVVATVRDTGVEYLRTWLPAKLFATVRAVRVGPFDDAEAEILGQAVPALAPLLFGPEAVRTVVRRPFFASVLAKEAALGQVSASSEVDLAQLWWAQGGYSADPVRAQHRRAALVKLAQEGAARLGRRISAMSVEPQELVDLEADGIIRTVRVGHSVQFTHDIFFEWAFLQYLVGEEDNWAAAVRRVGEPPALGRVVELLSQAELRLGENWTRYLRMLESSEELRSQWFRAWLAGPFGLETFSEHSSAYSRALFEDPGRVRKLVVWYQAAKSQPDTSVLANPNAAELGPTQRLLYADMLSYPADVPSWVRFCSWLLEHSAEIPIDAIPNVVMAFDVWQNRYRHRANSVSDRIVRTCLAWLYHIQHIVHRREFSTDYGAWGQLNEHGYARDELKELESSLRSLVLASALRQRGLVTQYIRDLRHLERAPRGILASVFAHAPLLAQVCPAELVDVALNFLRRPLPLDVEREMRDRERYRSSRSLTGRDLAISDEALLSPAAPTREPFQSLFVHAPDEGRRLVRELSNHAIQAWRQMHRLSRDEVTPIPVVLDFPWARQVFWGDFQRYMGARGNWGPAAVSTGLMALEAWAFAQLESQVPVDELLRKVLEGHSSVGALAVAVAISLDSQHCSAVTLPIATDQRIWHHEVHRLVQDSHQSANLIGFFRPHEIRHARAVKAGNERQVRKADIRWLASLMVLRGGHLGTQASVAIQRFPLELPFETAEQRQDAKAVGEFRQTAENWAELGTRKNYRAELTPDKSKIAISVDNPKSREHDVQEMQARHVTMGRNLRLLNWTDTYFAKGQVKEELSIEDAVSAVKELYVEAMFDEGHNYTEQGHQRQAAVAGVAAVVLCEAVAEHADWAVEMCVRAAETPQVVDELFTASAVLMHHPVLYATRGLGAFFAQVEGDDVAQLQSLLIRLVSHPYEEISVAAFKGLLSAWTMHPDVAWEAMRTATELSLVQVRYDHSSYEAEDARHKYVEDVLSASWTRVTTGTPPDDELPALPMPWVEVPPEDAPTVRSRFARRPTLPWRPNPLQVNTTFLAKVLDVISIPTAMADERRAPEFLKWCEGLAAWTLGRIAPSWAQSRRDLDDDATDLYDWKRNLYRFLAQVSLHLPAAEGSRRFLAPVAAKDDETFCALTEFYVARLAGAVMDSSHIPANALELLSLARDRTLACRGWEGHGGTDRELEDIARELFFSVNLEAKAPVRFVNGKWSEVGAVISLVEPIVHAHGTTTTVGRYWIQLCENSFEYFPIEHFVGTLEHVLGPRDKPAQWRGTDLPARLSLLIQRFSEKTLAMPTSMPQALLRALDRLVEMGDRRAAAVQLSEVFRSVQLLALQPRGSPSSSKPAHPA